MGNKDTEKGIALNKDQRGQKGNGNMCILVGEERVDIVTLEVSLYLLLTWGPKSCAHVR